MLRALDRSSAKHRCDIEYLRRRPRPVIRQATAGLRLSELVYPSFAPATHFSPCQLGGALAERIPFCALYAPPHTGPAYLPNVLTLSCKPPHACLTAARQPPRLTKDSEGASCSRRDAEQFGAAHGCSAAEPTNRRLVSL